MAQIGWLLGGALFLALLAGVGLAVALLKARREISALRRQTEELRETGGAFRALADGAFQAIAVHRDNRFLYVNPSAEKLLNAPHEILYERSVESMLHPEDRERLNEYSRRRFAGEDAPTVYTFRLLRPDGTTVWVEGAASRIDWVGGPALLISVLDISERRAAQEAILREKRRAEMADRAKTEFLANMSHELRTPLNAIIGFAEILRDEMLGPLENEKYREYVTDIAESGHHLMAVLNDILDMAKIGAGEHHLQESDFDLAAAVVFCLRMVGERARRKGIVLCDLTHGMSIPFHGDERMIRQILLNLLVNAVKFTGKGGRILVAAAIDPDHGVSLLVQDTGTGIAAEDLDVVMRPFAQAGTALTRQHEGTGLGLPLVDALTKLHQGKFSLVSRPGFGTGAMVSFPPQRLRPGAGGMGKSSAGDGVSA